MSTTRSLAPTPSERERAAVVAPDTSTIVALAVIEHACIEPATKTTPMRVNVSSADEYATVGELLVEAKARRSQIVKGFKELKDPINEVRNKILDAERSALAAVDAFIAAADRSIIAFKREQERKQREAEELQRQEAERIAREQRQAEVEALVEQGEEEAAADLAAEPITPAPTPPAALDVAHVPTVKGLSIAKRWHAQITDPVKLLRWIAQAPDQRMQYITFDMKRLNDAARAQEASLSIPGVAAVEDEGTVGRPSAR